MNRETKPIDNLKDIPANLSDEEQLEFLETHGVSERFLEDAEEASEDERPRPRTKPINIRFDDFTLGRLKEMAERRNVGYQTLLKTFVLERLYEEEKREGTLPVERIQEQRMRESRKEARVIAEDPQAQQVQDTVGETVGHFVEAGQVADQAQEAAGQATQQAQGGEEPNATGAAKQKAEELGVDLSQVEGSGAGGRITVKDVEVRGANSKR